MLKREDVFCMKDKKEKSNRRLAALQQITIGDAKKQKIAKVSKPAYSTCQKTRSVRMALSSFNLPDRVKSLRNTKQYKTTNILTLVPQRVKD